MADRPTSVAKSVEGLHHEESALDRARALREQFARAQNDNQQQKESQTEKPPGEGSQMIKEDAPVLKPTPSGPMRRNVRTVRLPTPSWIKNTKRSRQARGGEKSAGSLQGAAR